MHAKRDSIGVYRRTKERLGYCQNDLPLPFVLFTGSYPLRVISADASTKHLKSQAWTEASSKDAMTYFRHKT